VSDPTLPADAASPAPRRGSWLYTQAGDLDPLWLFLGAHLVLGLFLVLGALFYGQRAVLAALAYNAVSVLILAIIKVPIDRARLLAPALPAATKALAAAVGPPVPGMDWHEQDPEPEEATAREGA
jgi:hypothetical protein